MRKLLLICFTCSISCLTAFPSLSNAQSTPADFFEKEIRPLLIEKCQSCHGAKKAMGELRLDSRAAILKGGDNGPAAVVGKPEESLLIKAVHHSGDLKMPPKQKLPATAIESLTHWIKSGMAWPETKTTAGSPEGWKKHWAFQPVKTPAIPAVDSPWAKTDIDRFILAKMREKKLSPSPIADKRTLIRRVTFDLIGLPPSPADIEAFLQDKSSNAFEKVVDRLLASPQYGERQARYWLDIARYADTKGYVFFEEAAYPWAYTYRDYVIQAFNDDLPYDQFLMQQLAADQLPLGDDKRPLRAMGFITLGGHFMSNPHDILDDRIDTITRGILGLTVTCARCHDHKFDPIPTRDYYSLYGMLASSEEPTVPPLYEAPPKTEAYTKFAAEMVIREGKLRAYVRKKRDELIRGTKVRAGEYMLAAHANRNQPNIDEFMLIADGNDLNPEMMRRWQIYLDRARKNKDPILTAWHRFADLPEKDFAKHAETLAKQLPADPTVHPLIGKAIAAKPPKTMAELAKIYRDIFNTADAKNTARQAKSLLAGAWFEPQTPPTDPALLTIFYSADAPPNVPQSDVGDLDLLPDRASQAELQKLRKDVETWRSSGPGAPPRAMVLVDTKKPYEPRVFKRGNPFNLGEAVPRQSLMVLAGETRKPFANGSGRLEFAQAVTSKTNPLTARVMVNRIWLNHFGKGLVATPSDFGLRSDPPTHPELLDHLAGWFMEHGWSLKKLHKYILLSSTWQQQSQDRDECRKVDPENVLLWKMNRRRLDFESTRDSLLVAGGSLDRKTGGPSVGNIFANSTRRTLYGHLDRLNVPGLYRTFDFPAPDATSPQRDTTTVAPQALFMMNHPLVAGAARNLLKRAEIANEKNPSQRIERIYAILFGRPPSEKEKAIGLQYTNDPANKDAWGRYVHALLQLNEFVFVD